MKKLLLAATSLVVLAAAPAFAADDPIDVKRIDQDIKVLASDAFEGRGPATEGEKKSVAYIIEQFKAAGLQPGGDLKGGARAWTQDVPLSRSVTKGPVTATVKAGGEVQTWKQGEQIAIRASQVSGDRLTIKDAPVVFVGYGITAPERNWNDFKGMDLKGKVALVLVNDPDFETGKGDFGGKAMTYYGRWTYKFEEAARQGAIGFLVIHERDPASYGWATVKNSNTNEIFDIIRKDPKAAHAPLEAWIQRDNAVDLFKKAGLDFEQQKKLAQSRDFKPVALNGVTFSTDYAIDAQKVVSHNVVGVLPGTTHPEERVIYSAHWDHEGISLPDAKGDKIYNGAVDNASGTAALMELGRAFAKGPRPERTIVFLAVTAEEKGLLGSEYYADNPLYPLATTVADLNMDGINVIGEAKNVSMSGNAPLSLQDNLIAVAKERGLYFSPDEHPESGGFYRSDHFPFAKRGVPAMSFGTGSDLVKGGKAAGEAAGQAYVKDKYHQPADEYDPNWDLSGAKQEVGLFYEIGRRLANSREWPAWKAGAEFKAARDKTAAQRK